MGQVDYCINAKSVSIIRRKSVPRRLNAAIRKAIAAIVEIDLEGRLLFVNERFAEMLGYSSNELLGAHRDELFDLDGDNPRFDVPLKRVKKRRTIQQPLSALAVDIIKEALTDEEQQFVFVSPRGDGAQVRVA